MVGKIHNINTQNRDSARNDFEKDFCTLLNNTFYGKTSENVQIRLKINFNKKQNIEEILKQQ